MEQKLSVKKSREAGNYGLEDDNVADICDFLQKNCFCKMTRLRLCQLPYEASVLFLPSYGWQGLILMQGLFPSHGRRSKGNSEAATVEVRGLDQH